MLLLTSPLESSSLEEKMVGIVEMNEIQVMAAATSLGPLSNKREYDFVYEEELCNAGVATAREEAVVLDEPGGLQVADSIRLSSLQELHVVLQLELHGIVYDAMYEVDESSVVPERGVEGVVVAPGHNNLAGRQQLLIFPANEADADLVRL